MAVPIINPQSSVPVLRVNQPWAFNLTLTAASEAATSWQALDELPAGLAINGTTGRISGTPTVAGVREVRIIAINGSGNSNKATVAFGILPVPYTAQGTMEINMDLDTRVVWNPQIANGGAPLFGKYRDKNTISLGIMKASILQDKVISEINVWLKESDDSTGFKISTGQFAKVGSGDNARFTVFLNWDNDKLKSMFGNWEGAATKGGFIWAEIELKLLEAPPGTSTATLNPLTSRTFVCEIQRDF